MNSYNAKEEKIIEMIKTLIDSGVSEQLIVSRFESKILDLKKSKLSYWFAQNVKGADVRAHGRVIINSRDSEWNYKFAKNVKESDINTHEQIIIKNGDPCYNYMFARYIEVSNVRAHGKAIINSGDPKWNYLFARDVKGSDVKAHGKAIINSGNPELNYLFARDVKMREQVVDKDVDLHNQIESELELLDNYLDDAMASEEKDTSKSMTK